MILGMINVARRTIVVADASTPGHSVFAQIAPLERIAALVTDKEPPSDLAQALKEGAS